MEQREFAKQLRHHLTESENRLWRRLRAHRLGGEKFRRQQPIGPYVVDFVHFGARLIVEADGGQHNGAPRDESRDAWQGNCMKHSSLPFKGRVGEGMGSARCKTDKKCLPKCPTPPYPPPSLPLEGGGENAPGIHAIALGCLVACARIQSNAVLE